MTLDEFFNGANLNPKNNVPVNARLFLKSIFYPSSISQNDFTKDELNTLRNAAINSSKRYNKYAGSYGDESRQILERIKSLPQGMEVEDQDGFTVPAGELASDLRGKLSNTLQYVDYGSPSINKYGSVAKVPIKNSFNDRAYALSLAIGRGKYIKDNNGNIHISDIYDFPGAKETQAMSMRERIMRILDRDAAANWNRLFGAIHTIGEQFSKEMPVDVQLQHGASGYY